MRLELLLFLAGSALSKTVYVTHTEITYVKGIKAGTAIEYPTIASSSSSSFISSSVATTSSVVVANYDAVAYTSSISSSSTSDSIAPKIWTPTEDTTQEATSTSSTSSTSTDAPTTTSPTSTLSSATSSSDSSIYDDINNGGSGLDKSFATSILNAHNSKRELHGVSDLSWSTTLYNYASNYASKYDCSGSLVHSDGPYGENLAIGYDADGAVTAWYNEGENYDYNTCSSLDHFTQIIWESTKQVGCAYKKCGGELGTYIICSYDPAGNVINESKVNIKAPVS